MAARTAARQLEFVWRGSASWGAASDVFAHNYPTGNYGPPPGFNWDWGSSDAYIVDDPASDEYNVPSRVEDFVGAAKTWLRQLRGGDVMFMMGTGSRAALLLPAWAGGRAAGRG